MEVSLLKSAISVLNVLNITEEWSAISRDNSVEVYPLKSSISYDVND